MKISKDAQFILFAIGWLGVLFLIGVFANFVADEPVSQGFIILSLAFLWFVVTGFYFEIRDRF